MGDEVRPSTNPDGFLTRTRRPLAADSGRVGSHGEPLLAALSYGAGEWPVFPVAGVIDGSVAAGGDPAAPTQASTR